MIAAALLAIVLVAFVARAVGLHTVFLDDGRVVFDVGDALYHVHRALYSLEHFPAYLAFDPCLNHPAGASVPYPPLPDLLVAGVSLALGGSVATFERVAAWLPAVLGSLAVLPVYALGRRLHGPGVGLGAAALLAFAPIPIAYARVGYADHHAAVLLLGAVILGGYVAALDERTDARRRVAVFAGLTLARAALLLTWQGALLYLGVGELALAMSAVLRGRTSALYAQALSAVGVVVLVAPFVALSATPLAGDYSASELSRLHLLVFAGEALVVGGCGLWMRWRPPDSTRAAAARAAGLAAAVAVAALAIPGVSNGLEPAFGFLAQRDQVGGVIAEQAPLLSLGGESSWIVGFQRMGLFLVLVPLVPWALLVRTRVDGLADASRYLFAWSLLTGVLAMQQVRYANDFAPVACVGFALLLAHGAGWLRRTTHCSTTLAGAAAVLAAIVLQLPTLSDSFGGRMGGTWQLATGGLPKSDRALETLGGTQLRFSEMVREATPESAGCDGSAAVPDYAILTPFTLGHAMHYWGRRATPADNFGPYVGVENFRAVRAFFSAEDEAAALAAVETLGVRYVVTEEEGERFLSGVGRRLHRQDGSATSRDAHWGRFRLLVEGPEGGLPSAASYGGSYLSTPPFKLFELVQGAVLEVPAEPGSTVEARVALETPSGRRIAYRARGRGDPDGFARLRVPYPTEATAPTRAVGRYRVASGTRRWNVAVSEADVRGGATLRLAP